MRKPRIYLDTSVIGGCFDPEFSVFSVELFQEIAREFFVPVISQVTIDEIMSAPSIVREKLKAVLGLAHTEVVSHSSEFTELAEAYIKEKAIPSKFREDATHIAIATIQKVDVLVSWNFKHIVNLRRIHLFNAVNIKLGYPTLEIRSPREVIENGGS